MNAKITELDYLQQNIAMLKNLPDGEKKAAITAFHKVGNIMMYEYQGIHFQSASLDNSDSIDDDLDHDNLKDTNYPERYALIIMGGVMIEQLLQSSPRISLASEVEIDKAMLLIQTADSNHSTGGVRHLEQYLNFANLACEILIENQKYIGAIYQELMRNRTLTHSEVESLLRNINQTISNK